MNGKAIEGNSLSSVDLTILANRFDYIVRDMMNTLLRTGRTTALAIGRDFTCTIVTGDGRLLTAAEGMPIHLFGSHLQARAVKEAHPALRSGDAYLDNDPYVGNTHMGDHTILVPVVVAGEHLFTVCAKAHLTDIGNSIPSAYHPLARDIYEEGALCFPAVQIQRDYADIEDIVRMCRRRIRMPELWYGDYLAMMGAARIGERRLHDVVAKYGVERIREFCSEWLNYSERMAAASIRKLASGSLSAKCAHDPLEETGEPIPIEAHIVIDNVSGYVDVDLTNNIDCLPNGLNLSAACSIGSAMTGVINCLQDNVPINDGLFRRIRVRVRDNCAVGQPRHPASCSMATTNLACRLVNLIQHSISELGDGFGLAEGGMAIAPSACVITGYDRRKNVHFMVQPTLAGSLGPATPRHDGTLMYGAPISGGASYVDSIEMLELRYPLLFHKWQLETDSGGAGRNRGAPAFSIEFAPRFDSIRVMWSIDGYRTPPRGARGGLPGSMAKAAIRRVDGEMQSLPPTVDVVVNVGERVCGLQNGGGGYGEPRSREPKSVVKDVMEGLVSIDAARELYGVCISGTLHAPTLDLAGTHQLRVAR